MHEVSSHRLLCTLPLLDGGQLWRVAAPAVVLADVVLEAAVVTLALHPVLSLTGIDGRRVGVVQRAVWWWATTAGGSMRHVDGRRWQRNGVCGQHTSGRQAGACEPVCRRRRPKRAGDARRRQRGKLRVRKGVAVRAGQGARRLYDVGGRRGKRMGRERIRASGQVNGGDVPGRRGWLMVLRKTLRGCVGRLGVGWGLLRLRRQRGGV